MFRRLPLVRSLFGGKPRSRRTRKPELHAPGILTRNGPTLEGDGLLRSFGCGQHKTVALQDVSLELQSGELNLLMGPSGSGKSTLLAVLSALLRPDGGRVRALGQDVWRMTEKELEQFRLRHCSYVFQGYNLFPALTARQQLEIVLRWGEGVGASEARRRADKVLGQLGLSKKTHLRPAQLSGGEKQRVAIGRALVKNPSFLFADEPTSALDWENGQQVIELLHEVAQKRGATVLVVTHDPRLLPFSDRVFELADGKLMNESAGSSHAGNAHHTSHPVHHYGHAPARNVQGKPGPRLRLQEPQVQQ
jgi:putative ABC transport system ATP-binding protein